MSEYTPCFNRTQKNLRRLFFCVTVTSGTNLLLARFGKALATLWVHLQRRVSESERVAVFSLVVLLTLGAVYLERSGWRRDCTGTPELSFEWLVLRLADETTANGSSLPAPPRQPSATSPWQVSRDCVRSLLAGWNPWSQAAQSSDCALNGEEFFMPEYSFLLAFASVFIFEVESF